MTDSERIDLACKVLDIANEARKVAMRHGRFGDRDWLPFDECARRTWLLGAHDCEARIMRGRGTWGRERGNVIGSQYELDMADLFDRAAALHEESSPTT